MKILKLSIAIAFILTGIIACRKTAIPSLNVTSDDAAAMLAGSLSSSSYGVNNISNDVSLNAQLSVNTKLACGSIQTDTMTRQNPQGTPYSFYYKLSYTHKLNCSATGLPDNINSSLSYTGNFSNPTLSISNSGTTVFTISGLAPAATIYSLNGEYKSTGSFKLNADTTNKGSANVDIVVKNVTINKTTQVIASGGTATVIVTGTTIKKGDFTYNGTLTFNGNAMATMALNGTNYSINLATGAVIKK